MKKQLQYFILSVLAFGLFSAVAGAQTKQNVATSFEGVYAGVELDASAGGGVEAYTYTYYFRPDGTYTTELDQPDWKIRVDGTYTLSGKVLTLLKKSGGKPKTMEIRGSRKIDYGGTTLSKFDFVNRVPATRLETVSATGAGGAGTGMPSVGVFSNRHFNFDGRGNFSNDDRTAVAVSGDDIGGGTTNNNKGSGTYTIKDSVLTLKFADGTTITKSFFYSFDKPDQQEAALINGSYYYQSEDVKKPSVIAEKKQQAPTSVKSKTASMAKFQGVYAGLEMSYGFNGMQTYTYAYYFRPDGTFASELDEPDWKTRVDGTFTVKGKIISLLRKGEIEPDTMEITDDRHIDDGFVLSKFEFTNAVPAKRLENKTASGSGGISTGGAVPYVGVFSNRVFNFDGRGNFTNDSQSTVAVIGNNVGGGKTNNNKGGGTYTIKDSVLTLKYPDGTVAVKSFFYKDGSRPGEEIMAMINGQFYFDYDDVEKSVIVEKKKETPPPVKQKIATAAKLSGVYAAISVGFYINNATDINTHTYYFRPNGTFATELDKPDWKTRVDGKYTIKGKIVTVVKNGAEPETIEIQDDGTLKEEGYFLSKHEFMNSVPAKRLEYQGSDSSGVVSGGLVYVGTTANRVFIFDGRGGFTNDDSSSFTIRDGGGRTDKKASGTYTIKDSVLTLKYADGTIQTKSFFFNDRQSNDEVSALIDGKFYFEYKTAETNAAEGKKETPKETANVTPVITAPDALSVLKAANRVHGGDKLDNLKTLKIAGKLTGANGAINHNVVILYDFVRLKNRTELAQNGKLDLVEQLDGAASFSWAKGQKSALPEARMAEMKETFSTGVFGLRGDVLKSIKVTSMNINQEKNLKTIKVLIGGKEYGWLFDHENRLVAESSVEDGQQTLDLSEDFRAVSGVLLPFSNMSQLGSLILELNLTSVEVNPNLTEKDWAPPR